jgi:Tfp pilus assembly protein PilE
MTGGKMDNFFNIIKKQQGSTLVLVMMILLVLSILGLALVTASTTNYVMNRAYVDANRAFYGADDILEQVHALLESQSIEAQKYAKQEIENHMADLIAMSTLIDEVTQEEYVDEELLEQNIRRYYHEKYNEYIFSEEVGEGVNRRDGGKRIIENTFAALRVEYTMPDAPPQNPEDDIDNIIVTKTYTINSALKKVKAVFQLLKEPQQLAVSKTVLRQKNPVWTRPVTTEGDLIVVGGKVTIEAAKRKHNDKDIYLDAVYAWGTNPGRLGNNNQPGEKYGGVVAGLEPEIATNLLGEKAVNIGMTTDGNGNVDSANTANYRSGKIEIKGNVYTNGYIHTAYGTATQPSSILIDIYQNQDDKDHPGSDNLDALANAENIGNVFAESIQTEKACEGNENVYGGSITVSGDVKLTDDIELNGIANRIDVEGSFYGISTGDPTGNFFNKSSAILYKDLTYRSKINIGRYVFVAGVAYIEDVVKDGTPYGYPYPIPYMTGESAAIAGNYYAYKYYWNEEDREANMDDDWNIGGYTYPMYSGVAGANGPNDCGSNRRERFMEYVRKQYADSTTYTSPIGMGAEYLTIGTGVGGVKGYSLGVLPANGYVYRPDFQGAESNGLIVGFDKYNSFVFITLIDTWKKQYNSATYILKEKSPGFINDANTVKTSSEFDHLVESGSYNINYDVTGNKCLIIKTTEADTVIDMSSLPKENGIVKGLIFTTGNLYLYSSSDVQFEGAIVAQGNIVFFGDKTKEIKYNEEAVINAINTNEDAVKFFSKGNKLLPGEVKFDAIMVKTQKTKNVKIVDWKEIR